MAQQNLSQQIARLKSLIGYPLFVRHAKGVRLTPAGAFLRDRTEILLASLQDALEITRRFGTGDAGSLLVSFCGSVMLTSVAGILRGFRSAYPNIALELKELHVNEQIAMLQRGVLDACFVRDCGHPGQLTSLCLLDEPYVAVVSQHHRLAFRRKIDPALLKDEPFILFSPDMAQRGIRKDARSLRGPRLSSKRSAGSRNSGHRWQLSSAPDLASRSLRPALQPSSCLVSAASPSSRSAARWSKSPFVTTQENPPLSGWWSMPGTSALEAHLSNEHWYRQVGIAEVTGLFEEAHRRFATSPRPQMTTTAFRRTNRLRAHQRVDRPFVWFGIRTGSHEPTSLGRYALSGWIQYCFVMRFRLRMLAVVLAFFGAVCCSAQDLALVGAKVYPSPTDSPIEHAAVVLHAGRIAAVGPSANIHIPNGTKVIDCTGFVVTAGFWNSHVHILTSSLIHADKLSPSEMTSQLQEMLTRWGFTTVFDIASVLRNTNLIRYRIASGESKGPRILTVGEPFWIKTPIYVQSFLDANQVKMPESHSIPEAQQRVKQQIRDGADGIKIFANSIEQNEILTMPRDLAQGIVAQAHALGKPVFAHVSNNEGIEIALRSGVDVIAHTTPMDKAWSPALTQRMVAAHACLTPTLTLWEFESRKGSISAADLEEGMKYAAQQLNAFLVAGGDVLFGTDVGYTDVFNTSEEFKWMSQGGMNYQQILASLTTNPAQRFGYSSHSGRISKGFDADLVVLQTDPAKDSAAFSQVRYTIRNGMVIYASAPQ